MELLTELIIIAVMLLVNAVLAAYEMALASVSHSRLLSLTNQKKAGASSALYMKERIEASLAMGQVGITLVGAIAAATGGAGADQILAPMIHESLHLSMRWSAALALILFVVPLSAVTIMFGELIPKLFAIENKERVCLQLSPAMRWLLLWTGPLVRFMEQVVKGVMKIGRARLKKDDPGEVSELYDLHAAVSLARTKRLMGPQQERIVLSAALLSRRKIHDIILPAADISILPSRMTLTEALIRAHLDLHTRFPISSIENDPQTIEGYITFKDLVSALKMHADTPNLKGIARPIKRMREDATISQVLEQMIREKLHIALVVSANDRVLGLVTLEDIIEELVGDIEDEADSLPQHLHPTSGGWIMGGGVPMNAVCSRLGVPWSPHFVAPGAFRLSDWVELTIGRPIKRGEIMREQGIEITVRKVRRRKLGEAFVRKVPDTAAAN